MLLTQVLTTAFVIVGCFIIFYIIGVHCYCVILGIEVDEDKIMGNVHTVIGVMSFITMLTVFSLIYELTLHLAS